MDEIRSERMLVDRVIKTRKEGRDLVRGRFIGSLNEHPLSLKVENKINPNATS